MKNPRSFLILASLVGVLGLAHPASAQLASRSAEEWVKTLETPERIASLKIDETLAKLRLKPGDVVADIGAGSGIFEAPLAHAVSPGGKVYAVDIQQDLVDHITQRAGEMHLANVQGVLGKFTDPALPVRNIDLAFINDVLHHIQDRPAYLKNLAGYLKPTGRVAVIEFVPALGSHKDQPELQVSESQGAALMAAAGLKPLEKVQLFDEKWFVVYGK